jgi:RNase P/RNase MRP subunit p29
LLVVVQEQENTLVVQAQAAVVQVGLEHRQRFQFPQQQQ